MFPSQDSAEFTKDNRARKAMRFAAMLATRGIEEEAPCVAASRRFLESPFFIFMALLRVTLGFSVSGQKSLATARDAGADMTDAVNRWVDDTPKEMYAPRTLPAIVAKPAVIMAWSSDRVTYGKYGWTSRGDSVCPTNILPAATTDSIGDDPIVTSIVHPTFLMSHCINPRKYSMDITVLKKTTMGRILNAKKWSVYFSPKTKTAPASVYPRKV